MRWIVALLLLVAACDRAAERFEFLSDAPSPTATADVHPATPDDRRRWLELYDEAGYPDVSALQRVELEVGQSQREAGDEPMLERAWLLSTSPLVLLQDSLWKLEPEPNSYREVDFADELRAELDAVEARTEGDDAYQPPFVMRTPRIGPPATYWLARARWAEMRGAPELAQRALAQVERWTSLCGEDVCSPEDAIRNGFQLGLLWQAADGLANFMPRPQVRVLVARAQAIAPRGEHWVDATELLDRLDRTIATDANGPSWPDGGEPARVERLIHLLREQTTRYAGAVPCRPDTVCDPIRDPADELTALGREAIPALIEHLDDDTLTRSIRHDRDSGLFHDVLSVGDVALEIIERIAGRRFYLEDRFSNMSKASQAKAVQKLVREWWAGARQVSAREQLVHDLHNAEESERHRFAYHLLDKYGLEIWPELTRAFGETKDDEARRGLLNAMNQWWTPVGDEPADERAAIERFLIGALHDRSRTVRLAAAQALAERGRHDGSEIIIADLDRYWLDPHAWSSDHDYASYFGVLVADGSAAAVDAIDRAVQRRGYAALAALGRDGCRHWAKPCDPKLDGAAKARLLDTLAGYLDDFGDPGRQYGEGPARVRDMAAAAYSTLTGRDTEAFASKPTSIERDWMILDMLNAHRAEQDQPPVSWPHVVPLEGARGDDDVGRDHVQRVHLVRADVHEAAAREWLEGFADRYLNPHEISTALVDLAQRHPDVPFTLRIWRFPDDAGVILILEVGPHTPSQSRGRIESDVDCGGIDCGGSSLRSSIEPAPEVFADILHDRLLAAWNRKPTQIEEYMFRVKVSPPESRARAALRCSFTDGEDSDSGWLLLIAGLIPAGLAYRRRR
jgi:hypothetical protein